MEVGEVLLAKGMELGLALKNKNAEHYAKAKMHNALEPYATMDDKIQCLLEFAVSCGKELPMEIISGENRERDIRFYMAGVSNGLVKK